MRTKLANTPQNRVRLQNHRAFEALLIETRELLPSYVHFLIEAYRVSAKSSTRLGVTLAFLVTRKLHSRVVILISQDMPQNFLNNS